MCNYVPHSAIIPHSLKTKTKTQRKKKLHSSVHYFSLSSLSLLSKGRTRREVHINSSSGFFSPHIFRLGRFPMRGLGFLPLFSISPSPLLFALHPSSSLSLCLFRSSTPLRLRFRVFDCGCGCVCCSWEGLDIHTHIQTKNGAREPRLVLVVRLSLYEWGGEREDDSFLLFILQFLTKRREKERKRDHLACFLKGLRQVTYFPIPPLHPWNGHCIFLVFSLSSCCRLLLLLFLIFKVLSHENWAHFEGGGRAKEWAAHVETRRLEEEKRERRAAK